MIKYEIRPMKINIWQGKAQKNMKKEIKQVPKIKCLAKAENMIKGIIIRSRKNKGK